MILSSLSQDAMAEDEEEFSSPDCCVCPCCCCCYCTCRKYTKDLELLTIKIESLKIIGKHRSMKETQDYSMYCHYHLQHADIFLYISLYIHTHFNKVPIFFCITLIFPCISKTICSADICRKKQRRSRETRSAYLNRRLSSQVRFKQ